MGRYLERYGEQPNVTFHTKWVPAPGPMPKEVVLQALDVSRGRMATDSLDLVAFHWWDYQDRRSAGEREG